MIRQNSPVSTSRALVDCGVALTIDPGSKALSCTPILSAPLVRCQFLPVNGPLTTSLWYHLALYFSKIAPSFLPGGISIPARYLFQRSSEAKS